jgi:NADH dehydrogenase FAD-containing subunit
MRRIEVDRVVALPRLRGRTPDGVPADGDSFVAVDRHRKVTKLRHVWAAGDGVALPVKFGGLATAQADAAAEAIAALAGAHVTPEPFVAHWPSTAAITSGSAVGPRGGRPPQHSTIKPLAGPIGTKACPGMRSDHKKALQMQGFLDRGDRI